MSRGLVILTSLLSYGAESPQNGRTNGGLGGAFYIAFTLDDNLATPNRRSSNMNFFWKNTQAPACQRCTLTIGGTKAGKSSNELIKEFQEKGNEIGNEGGYC